MSFEDFRSRMWYSMTGEDVEKQPDGLEELICDELWVDILGKIDENESAKKTSD